MFEYNGPIYNEIVSLYMYYINYESALSCFGGTEKMNIEHRTSNIEF